MPPSLPAVLERDRRTSRISRCISPPDVAAGGRETDVSAGEDDLATHERAVQPRGALTVQRVLEKLPRIWALVLLRYTFIIAVAYLLLAEHGFSSPPTGPMLLIVAALMSNLLIPRLPARITDSTPFNASIIVGDTVWITAVMLYSGLFSPDFFYLYFFVLLLAAIGENLGLIVVGTIAICIAYLYVLSASGDTSTLWGSPSLIRIPFLFTAAAFYGYLVDQVRREKQRAREETHQRKQVQQDLRAARDYAQNLIDSSLDMIISADGDRNIMEFNPAAERAFGYSKAEVFGKSIDILYADPSAGRRVNTNTHDGGFTGEVANRRKSGEIFYSYVSASPMRDADSRIVGVMGVSQDITERREAEALRQANAELKKSHEELKGAQLQLIQAEKLQSAGRLAAGVAHEVKNPLAIILMGVDYLSKHLTVADPDPAMVLRDMHDAVKRATSVVGGLLDFSAPTELDLNSEELNSVVEQSAMLVKHELTKYQITVVKQLGGDLPLLTLDRNKIEQVFVNIFLNAIHAMPQGGALTVKTYAKQLTEVSHDVGFREADRFRVGETVAVAEVEDTGTGIPESQLAKIFDPFFTTNPTGKGSGLGLAVTNKIIELHGGTIDIRNRKEGGVGVTIMFRVERRNDDGEETDLDN